MDPFATVYGQEWFRDLDANLVFTNKGVFPLVPTAQIIAIGTLAGTDSLIAIAADKPLVTSVGTLAGTNPLVNIPPIKVAPIGTLDEINVLIAIQAVKDIITDVTTLAEIEALLAIQTRKIANIGTLAELEALIPLIFPLDGSTDLFITIDLTDNAVLRAVQEARGLGVPQSGDHAAKIYAPDRRILRR